MTSTGGPSLACPSPGRVSVEGETAKGAGDWDESSLPREPKEGKTLLEFFRVLPRTVRRWSARAAAFGALIAAFAWQTPWANLDAMKAFTYTVNHVRAEMPARLHKPADEILRQRDPEALGRGVSSITLIAVYKGLAESAYPMRIVWVSMAELASRAGCEEGTARRAVRVLEALGVVFTFERWEAEDREAWSSLFRTNLYVLLPIEEWPEEIRPTQPRRRTPRARAVQALDPPQPAPAGQAPTPQEQPTPAPVPSSPSATVPTSCDADLRAGLAALEKLTGIRFEHHAVAEAGRERGCSLELTARTVEQLVAKLKTTQRLAETAWTPHALAAKLDAFLEASAVRAGAGRREDPPAPVGTSEDAGAARSRRTVSLAELQREADQQRQARIAALARSGVTLPDQSTWGREPGAPIAAPAALAELEARAAELDDALEERVEAGPDPPLSSRPPA